LEKDYNNCNCANDRIGLYTCGFSRHSVEDILIPKLKSVGIKAHRNKRDNSIKICGYLNMRAFFNFIGWESPIPCYSYKFDVSDYIRANAIKLCDLHLDKQSKTYLNEKIKNDEAVWAIKFQDSPMWFVYSSAVCGVLDMIKTWQDERRTTKQKKLENANPLAYDLNKLGILKKLYLNGCSLWELEHNSEKLFGFNASIYKIKKALTRNGVNLKIRGHHPNRLCNGSDNPRSPAYAIGCHLFD